ncbi:GNAT family N-acetyltransferase [Paenibacillus barengoltzii]|jgi:GNAT superfamily N-acetyltransferase|uniref:GNAT family N-acetyltransferase n=1 Tax=Paenibacillus barengoltzii TaxID=343517 RepID=UPI003F88E548
MVENFVIVPLTAEDREQACRVFEQTIPEAFAAEGLGHLIEDIREEVDGKRKLVNAALGAASSSDPHGKGKTAGESPVLFLVAKIGREVVGTISFGPCGKETRDCTQHALDEVGELGSLYVLPANQGQGIGAALIEAMAKALQERGIEQFCLDSGYKRAQQKWLRKFGEPYVVAKDYWGPGQDHMVWLCQVEDYAVRR